MHGRDAEADGAVRLLRHAGAGPQAPHGDDAPRHQPALVPILHVQSGAGAGRQRELGKRTLDHWEYLHFFATKRATLSLIRATFFRVFVCHFVKIP